MKVEAHTRAASASRSAARYAQERGRLRCQQCAGIALRRVLTEKAGLVLTGWRVQPPGCWERTAAPESGA
jgi:hypothetical protein